MKKLFKIRVRWLRTGVKCARVIDVQSCPSDELSGSLAELAQQALVGGDEPAVALDARAR
jgi:hypothetical protein